MIATVEDLIDANASCQVLYVYIFFCFIWYTRGQSCIKYAHFQQLSFLCTRERMFFDLESNYVARDFIMHSYSEKLTQALNYVP